ncbi:MAG: DEAD/DEAH box helicase [Halioglobus sp.]
MFAEIPFERSLRLGLDALEFAEPTPVQAAVVPIALQGRDIQVSAETGSGKTFAYLLPLVQNILMSTAAQQEGTLALVLVPTRELARQVLKQTRHLLMKTNLTAAGITGGADFKYQKALLRKDPEIVVATPGRWLEHCRKGSVKADCLQTLVLDEADRMLDLGFRDDVIAIAKQCNPQRQTLMLSATLGHGGVKQIAQTLLKNPERISLAEPRQPHSAIGHQLILADSVAHKDKLLASLLKTTTFRRALVFANKRITAARLSKILRAESVRCGALHGEMSTEERTHVMQQFHGDKIDVLCASDVAARGLDVKGVDIVVNYDMPYSGDDYLHRTGRTGRAGASGTAVTLLVASEWNLMISVQRYLGLEFERKALSGLKAKYNGPKKQKSDGRAAGIKKKKSKKGPAGKKKVPSKSKSAKKPAKQSGKKPTAVSNDGFAPLKKRPKT